jgi:hypothetical protein
MKCFWQTPQELLVKILTAYSLLLKIKDKNDPSKAQSMNFLTSEALPGKQHLA